MPVLEDRYRDAVQEARSFSGRRPLGLEALISVVPDDLTVDIRGTTPLQFAKDFVESQVEVCSCRFLPPFL